MYTHTHMRTQHTPFPKGYLSPIPRTSVSAGPKALSVVAVPHLWSVTSVGSLSLGNKPGSFGGGSRLLARKQTGSLLNSSPPQPHPQGGRLIELNLAWQRARSWGTEAGERW